MLLALLPAVQAGQPPKPKEITGAFDYPTAALVKGVQGAVYYQMMVRADGKPAGCTVTKASGSHELDKGTCTCARAFTNLEPTQDAQGLRVQDIYNLIRPAKAITVKRRAPPERTALHASS